ncbi:MAG: MBL fold metallo-hydrolase [bacterium]|nr:MBL fold metallo-hydrolase [bacterium]
MQLTWHGLSCFRLQSDSASIITDPLLSGSGLRGPRISANLVAVTDPTTAKHLDLPDGPTAPRLVAGPGEYEAGGILVEGVAAKRGGPLTAYRIIIDGINIVTVGTLGELPDSEAVAALAGADILLVPVGGGSVLSGKQAAELVTLLEPRIVVPCYFKIPGLTVKADPLDKFCQEIGICPKDTLPKLKLTRKDLPAEEMKVIVLEKA